MSLTARGPDEGSRPQDDGSLPASTREAVDDLLEAVDQRPCELPLGELACLSGGGLKVSIDRRGAAPVVYLRPDQDPVFARLSRRESDVVTLLAAGFSNEQIASTLYVSVATVKGHIHSVFTKTGFSSRTQVVAAWYGGIRSAAPGEGPEG